MDWKFKHFNHEAIFNASRETVLEAARTIVNESFGKTEDTADGFVAHGYSAWHMANVTFHITSTLNGTKVAVELLVERAAMRGYMLVDIGGYYDGQIDKWFSAISQHLGETQEQVLVSKTTSNVRVRRGCLTGCLVYLLVGACLGIFAIPLDRTRFPGSSASFQGPFGVLASVIGFVAGIGAFLYVMNPDAPASKFIRERLQRNQTKRRE